MKGATKQTLGAMVLFSGIVTLFNSIAFHAAGPFWLGGSITIAGVLLVMLGWKMITRGSSDEALEAARHNDEQTARHRANLDSEDPNTRHQGRGAERSSEAGSSLEDPTEPR